jgi:chemotaxis protein CheD
MQTNRQKRSESGAPRVHIGIAEHDLRTEPAVLETSGLGSCLGVCLYDDEGRGGLAHCMLPSVDDASDGNGTKPAKFVDTGVETLYEGLLDLGASPGAIRAKVAGGSDMLGLSDGPTVGERNVAAARAELDARDIPVVAERTNGEQGRSLAFETATGRLRVTAAGGSTTVL